MSTTAIPAAQVRHTLLLLFLINFLNFFDRIMPTVVFEPIREEFRLNDTQLGLIGTAFTVLYALVGLPLGRLADRWSRPKLLASGVAVWSVMTAASAYAWNFMSFLLSRLGVGVGEASCAPAANSLIGDLVPPAQRARALGIFMLGLPVGNLACYLLVGWMAFHWGWRMPFLLAAIPGIVLAVLLWRLKDPQRGAQDPALNAAVDRPFRRLLGIPTLWWVIVSGAAINFAAYALATFLPSLLIRYHGLNLAQAGAVAAIVMGVTGLLGLTAGGWVADLVHQRWQRGRLMFGACAMLAAAPLLWFGLAQPAGAVTALTWLLSGAWLLYFIYYVTVYAALQDVVQPRLRATAMAVYFCFQYILGAGFGSTITGALSDHYAEAERLAFGAAEMAPAFRALGLKDAMVVLLPAALLITGIALLGAAWTFVRDRQRAVMTPAAAAA